jgi:hypothetical protein
MKAAAFVLLLCTASSFAQIPKPAASPIRQKGSWDLGGWLLGGHSVSGGTSGVGAFSAGFRVGKILTNEKGRGWYRGNLEVAADAIPLTLIFQERAPDLICIPEFPQPCQSRTTRKQTVYGGGFNPLMTIWNFTAPRSFTPYLEIGGGLLFTNSDVPAFTSDVNFTPQIAFGVHLLQRSSQSLSFAGRYLHISNAGLGSLNAGINTIQFSLGYHWYR